MRRPSPVLLLVAVLVMGCGADPEGEGVLRVAVAANFVETQAELARLFQERTGRRVASSPGSSGQLYAQIRNGAPYHVFLSADDARPADLEREGAALGGTRFTYALGRLALFGPGLDSVLPGGSDLRDPAARVAIANPVTAPYGAAALDVLDALGLREVVQERLVRAESVAQVHQFVASGAAELGFLALSQVRDRPPRSYWLVPPSLHRPIVQDAVLLAGGASHPTAVAYLRFLRSPEARALIRAHGYATSEEGT